MTTQRESQPADRDAAGDMELAQVLEACLLDLESGRPVDRSALAERTAMSPASPPVVSLTTLVLVALSLAAPEALAQPVRFQRGDANADGELNLTDPIFTLNHLFLSGRAPSCADAADAQDDGKVDTADAVYTLSYLFRGDRPPPAPFGECGLDPAGDELGCATFGECGQEEGTGLREAWLLRVPEIVTPTAIAADPRGGFYVAGYAGQFPSYSGVMKRYDPEGNEVWSTPLTRGNAPINGSLTAGALGSVFVTGLGECDGDQDLRDLVTTKHDASGQEVWAGCHGPTAFTSDDGHAVDRDGNVYVQLDSGVVKFTSDGRFAWMARQGPGFRLSLRPAIAVDGAGNVFVGGQRYLDGNDSGFVVWKYDPEGNLAWMAEDDHTYGYTLDLTADEAGNVYVQGEGFSCGNADCSEFLTVKYTPDGERAWTVKTAAPQNEIAVDGRGNVYTTGGVGVGVYGWRTTKYDPESGSVLWLSRFNPDPAEQGERLSESRDFLVDPAGNVYITGIVHGSRFNSGVTVKYSAAGKEVWVGRHAWTPDRGETVRDMAVDSASGSLYLLGLSYIDRTDSYTVIVKYVPEK